MLSEPSECGDGGEGVCGCMGGGAEVLLEAAGAGDDAPSFQAAGAAERDSGFFNDGVASTADTRADTQAGALGLSGELMLDVFRRLGEGRGPRRGARAPALFMGI